MKQWYMNIVMNDLFRLCSIAFNDVYMCTADQKYTPHL
jgi:hypothetical protein